MAVVGIDVGTQSLKAVVTSDDLVVRGEGSVAYQPVYPRPGWAEQDPRLWEDALGPAIAVALDEARCDAGAVRGIGIAGQLDGCVAVDAAGRALGPALPWLDRRAEAETAGLPAAHVRAHTGVVLDPTHMAAKIRWMKRRGVRAVRFHQPVSYLVARLTGEHVFDHALASTTMLYRLAERTWDAGLLEMFGIGAEELPRIAEAEACAGPLGAGGAVLTGLREGTPVAVGTGDDFANPLGAGLTAPGRVAVTLGTAEVVGALHERPLVDPGALVETHGYPGGLWFIENPGWLSGGALSWFVDTWGLADVAALDRLAAAAPPGSGGVVFLPALSGAMTPEWVAGARGCFYGLTPAHGTAHMARAVLEGCAFAMRDVVERLDALGVDAGALLFIGGGARSRLWTQMRADLTGLPGTVPRRTATSPLGAAVLGAVAGGVARSLADAAALVGGGGLRVEPDPAVRGAYDDAYGLYRRLFEALRPLYGAAP